MVRFAAIRQGARAAALSYLMGSGAGAGLRCTAGPGHAATPLGHAAATRATPGHATAARAATAGLPGHAAAARAAAGLPKSTATVRASATPACATASPTAAARAAGTRATACRTTASLATTTGAPIPPASPVSSAAPARAPSSTRRISTRGVDGRDPCITHTGAGSYGQQ